MPKRREVRIVAVLQDLISQPAQRVVQSAQRIDKAFRQISGDKALNTTVLKSRVRDLQQTLNKAAREVEGTPLAANIERIQKKLNALGRGRFTRTTQRNLLKVTQELNRLGREANQSVGPQDRLTRTLRESAEAAGQASRAFDVLGGDSEQTKDNVRELRAELKRFAAAARDADNPAFAARAQGLARRFEGQLARTPARDAAGVVGQFRGELAGLSAGIDEDDVDETSIAFRRLQAAMGRVERQTAETVRAQRRLSPAIDRTKRAAMGLVRSLSRVSLSLLRATRRLRTFLSGVRRGPARFLRFVRALLTLRATIVTVIAVMGVGAIARYADAWIQLENRLRLVTESHEQAGATMQRVFDIAQRSRLAFATVGEVYFRIARGSEQFRRDQERLLGVVEAVTQAIQLSGVTAEAARNAMIQFGQGLASQNLGGDELRSVLEQTPRLGFAIARGLERDGEIGVSFGQLRELGAERALTTQALLEAIERQADVLEEEFSQVQITISQGAQRVQNSFARAIGQLGTQSGLVQRVVTILVNLSNKIDSLADDISANILGPINPLAQAASDRFVPQARAAARARAESEGRELTDAEIRDITEQAEAIRQRAQRNLIAFFVGGPQLGTRRNEEGEEVQRSGVFAQTMQFIARAVQSLVDRLVSAILRLLGFAVDELGRTIRAAIERVIVEALPDEGLILNIPVLGKATLLSAEQVRRQKLALSSDNDIEGRRALIARLETERERFEDRKPVPPPATIGEDFRGFFGHVTQELPAEARDVALAQTVAIRAIDKDIERLRQEIEIIQDREQDTTTFADRSLEALKSARAALSGKSTIFGGTQPTIGELLLDLREGIGEIARAAGTPFGDLVSDWLGTGPKDRFASNVRRSLQGALQSQNIRFSEADLTELVDIADRGRRGGFEQTFEAFGAILRVMDRLRRETEASRFVQRVERQDLPEAERRLRAAQARGLPGTDRLQTRVEDLREITRLATNTGEVDPEELNFLREQQRIQRQRVAVEDQLDHAKQQVNETIEEGSRKLQRYNELVASGQMNFRRATEQEKALREEVTEELNRQLLAIDKLLSRVQDPQVREALQEQRQALVEETQRSLAEVDVPAFVTIDRELELIAQDRLPNFRESFKASAQELIGQFNSISNLGNALGRTVTGAFQQISSAIVDSIANARSFGEAFRGVARSLLIQIAQLLIQFALLRAVTSVFGLGVGTGGFAVAQQVVGATGPAATGFNEGGLFRGRPGRDQNTIRVSDNEFIMPASSVKQYGVGVMEAMRSRLVPPEAVRPFSSPAAATRKGLRAVGRFAQGGSAAGTGGQPPIVPALVLDGETGEKLAKLTVPFIIDEISTFRRPEARAMTQG